ncbi:MAG TPA: tetratricopeptide repeat protein [Phycisphaerae bacterium]|nr:tetratricopeptide repeat protein [Phycisphaerae bacterium]
MSDFQQQLDDAREQLDAGEASAAFQLIRGVFFDLELASNDDDLSKALNGLAPIAGALGGTDFQDAISNCAKNLDDPEALFEVAQTFIEEEVFDVAACLLMRVHELVPEEADVVAVLIDVLEDDGRFEEAFGILKEVAEDFPDDFYIQGLQAFNAVMCGDLNAARIFAASLPTPVDEDDQFFGEQIKSILARADEIKGVCDLGESDLRGWHYVVSGGLVSHLSPFELEEDMNGRYAYTSDTYARCREGIMRLKAALDLLGCKPECIQILPERGSQIMGLAAGTLLDLPVRPWKGDGQNSLVIAYDLADLDEELGEALWEHKPGQILFAHATCWTDVYPFVADITTYLYQHQSSPWGDRMEMQGDEVEMMPADDAAPEDLAARIIEAEWDSDEEDANDRSQAEKVAAKIGELCAARQDSGPRSRLWTGPVKSGQFE